MAPSKVMLDVYPDDSFFQHEVNLLILPDGDQELTVKVDSRPNVTEVYEKKINVTKPLCEFESKFSVASGLLYCVGFLFKLHTLIQRNQKT